MTNATIDIHTDSVDMSAKVSALELSVPNAVETYPITNEIDGSNRPAKIAPNPPINRYRVSQPLVYLKNFTNLMVCIAVGCTLSDELICVFILGFFRSA